MADHIQYNPHRQRPGPFYVLKCSRIGWMGNLLKTRWCFRCGIQTSQAYKVYWEDVGSLYRSGPYRMETYCHMCAEAVVAAYELDRMVNGA